MVLSLPLIAGLAGCGVIAGLLGALAGIGGGIIIVPTLVLLFGIDIKLAVATSLVAVIATSTAAGSVYVGKGLTNMRLGMTLEIATTLGGITGGLLAVLVSDYILAGLFSVMVTITAGLMLKGRDAHEKSNHGTNGNSATPTAGHEEPGQLAGSYYDSFHKQLVHYKAERLPLGAGVSFGAGIVSGMLGVGGGFIKVPAMNLAMKVPVKVAAATSNFMIGVTAVSSLFVYLARGLVHPLIAVPITVGVVGGAIFGTWIAPRISSAWLRRILAVVLIVAAVQMMFKAFGVTLG